MNIYKVVNEVNKDPDSEFISECGKYTINKDRYKIEWQQGNPVWSLSIKGLPTSLNWIKR
ncbi:hypothetical protein [Aquibacillus saliphilus]|uniref:hypothetical protein n=1 Tax=Aquibacillus saliphilus TaxID=1909422 RepID=UPI001CF03875|nr:hypothetical protein [Aquibacillus saliphilus]